MNKLTKMTGMLALAFSLNASGATDYVELSKELEIMNSVLATSLKQNGRDDAIRFRGLETSYLASQGVVFNVSTSRGSYGLNFDILQFIEPPVAPAAPIIIGGDGRSIQIEVGDDFESIIEDSVRKVERVFRESSEQLREIRRDARELSWELREHERRARDLNFELRNADDKRKARIEEQKNELQQEIAEIKQRQAELDTYANSIEAEQKEQLAKQKAAYEEANKGFLANFEDRIADTLCRFGAGLRALPDDEHISFVLKNFHSAEKNGKKDRIYVFAEEDIKSCVQERIDATELLAKATVYQF